jgi:hypothetical protein
MFDLPLVAVSDLGRYADWVELCALTAGSPVARVNLADVAKDSGLVQPIATDLFPGDVDFADAEMLSPEDITDHFSELVWEELQARADSLGPSYPFNIRADLVEPAVDWKTRCAYVLLLIADISRFYNVPISTERGSKFEYLFEKVVQAAAEGLAGGACVRFGWPRED